MLDDKDTFQDRRIESRMASRAYRIACTLGIGVWVPDCNQEWVLKSRHCKTVRDFLVYTPKIDKDLVELGLLLIRENKNAEL